jgi:hypothetical protein
MIEPRSRPLEPPAPVIEAAEVAVLYRPGRWYTWRTWDHLWLMFFCARLKELMQGFLYFL